MKYAIIGTGALGGYYGGRLANAGKDVHFLYHSEYEYVKEHGLKVNSCNGDFYLPQINVYNSTSDMPKCDVVLVTLKTTQNHLLADMLVPIIKADSLVILIQNGIDYEEMLVDELTKKGISVAVGGGLAFICASRTGAGEVTHYDYGKLTLGIMASHSSKYFDVVASDFVEAGVEVVKADSLLTARWKKLVWNVPFNPLSVTEHCDTGELLDTKEKRDYVRAIMLEVINAGNKEGAGIDLNFADEMIESTLVMKPYLPSMRLDYDAGRKMELDAILRNPIARAKRNGFEMPLTSKLLNKIEQII